MAKFDQKSLVVALTFVSLVSVVKCGWNDLFVNQTRVEECEKAFEMVKDLNSLETVMDHTIESYNKKYLSNRVVAKCLGIKKDVIDKIDKFRFLIRVATRTYMSNICKRKSVDRITNIYSQMMKDGGKFTPWWDRFVFNVVASCKRNLVKLLETLTENRFLFIKIIFDLAQNFNWQDVHHFIRDGDVQHININAFKKNLEDVNALSKSSGDLEDILRVRNFQQNHMDDKRKTVRCEFEVTKHQYDHLKNLLDSCSRIEHDYIVKIAPVMDLIGLGYDLSASKVDEYLASSMYINIWIVAVQMCDAFKLVKIQYILYRDGHAKLTFRTDINGKVENMGDSLSTVIAYPFEVSAPGRIWHGNYVSLFETLDTVDGFKFLESDNNFMPLHSTDYEITTRKNSIKNENSKVVVKKILSQEFVDKLASYFKSA